MKAAFLTGLREMEIREISELELSSPQLRFSPSSKTKQGGRNTLLLGTASSAVWLAKRSRNIAKERLGRWIISFDRIPHHATVP